MTRMELSDYERKALRARLAARSRPTQAKLTPEERIALVRDFLQDGSVSLAAVARKYGITRQSAHYLVKIHAHSGL